MDEILASDIHKKMITKTISWEWSRSSDPDHSRFNTLFRKLISEVTSCLISVLSNFRVYLLLVVWYQFGTFGGMWFHFHRVDGPKPVCLCSRIRLCRYGWAGANDLLLRLVAPRQPHPIRSTRLPLLPPFLPPPPAKQIGLTIRPLP